MQPGGFAVRCSPEVNCRCEISLVYPLLWKNNFRTKLHMDVRVGWWNPHASQLRLSIWFPGSTVSHKAHGKTLEKGHSPPEGSSSKRVPRKHKNAARGSAPPKPPNSLSDGSDGVSGAGLRRKPVGKLLGRRILGSDRSTRDRNGKARPALGVEPNLLPPIPEEIKDDRKHKLRKQVRRFGRSKCWENG
jgi:hypothetical protein